jgi:hypothetical protein
LNEGKGTSAAELKTINPATEEVINRYEIITKEQINDKVKTHTGVLQLELKWHKGQHRR